MSARPALRIFCAVLCLALFAAMLPARAQEEKRTNNDWIYILLGGGLIYLLTHHPHTQTRESPSPSPSAEPTPEPRHTPDIYGHDDYTCTRSLGDGAFEAIQGPYQDDPIFKNKPDQLRREDGSKISYYGELDMVQNRPSTLAGVDAYVKDGTLTQIGSRNIIFMSGMTNCRDAKPVRMRFWLYEAGTKRKIYDSPLQLLQLFGPSNHTGQSVPWKMLVPAVLGQPEGAPFYFTRPFDFYAIEAELIDEHDHSLGFSMWLNGHVTQTTGPLTLLQPVVLSVTRSASSFDQKGKVLSDDAAAMATGMYENIPDVYPLVPKGLPMPRLGDPLDLSNANVLDSSWSDAFKADVFINKRHNQNFAAALSDRLGATAVMQGVARTIALLTEKDMDLLDAGAAGRTLSTKVIIVRGQEPWTTPAHELAHSLPEYIWSSPSMSSDCELDYHNKSKDISYGLQLTEKNVVTSPWRHQGTPADLMGDPYTLAWNGQCTYSHLIDGLRAMVDPPVLLVRFGMANEPRGVRAKLLPFYDEQAIVSRDDRHGKYSVVALDSSGGTVTRRRFNPPWIDENGARHDVISMQEHLPNSAAIASVQLRGPAGLLDAVTLSRTAPAVTIDRATVSGRTLNVSWRGRGEPGRTLRYSVLLSPDGGRTFRERIFESKANSASLHLYERPPLVVRVVVTDGSRSAQTQRKVPR